LSEETNIRFALPADLEFLEENSNISNGVLSRKIEWQEMIVAMRSGGELIGFIQLEYLWSKVPYIALIKVLPEYRRQGTAMRLLEFAGEFLSANGHKELYSSSQADEPEPQAWHRQAGFEECGIIAGINKGIGEVFFRKRL
jgi:N-acetylglutamate synthase-like GNAT family acetyltransferase